MHNKMMQLNYENQSTTTVPMPSRPSVKRVLSSPADDKVRHDEMNNPGVPAVVP